MSDADTTPPAADATDDHADGHGHSHDAASEPPGPIDVTGWLYALGGGVIALVLAWALFIAGGG